MTAPEPPAGGRRGRLARGFVLTLAVTLAAAAIAEHRLWSRQRGRLLAMLSDAGTTTREPAVATDVGREPDRRRAALRAARAVLADELDRGWQAGFSPEQRQEAERRGLVKLEWARDIAADALARRPASWQAAEVLGATRYLDALRRRLPMTAERREAWRRPLVAARRLGPGQAEPTRFLAAATLSEWSRLSAAEREDAIGLVRDAFADPATFDLLAASWLRLAPSRQLAFSVVPPQPRAWQGIQDFYAARGDWDSFSLAHERQRDALYARLEDRLARAGRRLAGGDRRRARWFALEVLEKAPPSRRFAPLFADALEVLPPGPLGEIRAARVGRWLDWSRELCLLGDCPFGPRLLARMSGLAAAGGAAEKAADAEMSGDWRAAELTARDHETLGPEWGPYHLLRARRLARAGDLDGHRRSLERVHAQWRHRAAYLETAALSGAGAAAPRALAPHRRAWPAAAWRAAAGPTLEIYADAACSRVELEVLAVPARGSAVEVSWDGEIVGTRAVTAGRPLRLDLTVDPDRPHRLTIDPFVHPRVRPGTARLRNCPG